MLLIPIIELWILILNFTKYLKIKIKYLFFSQKEDVMALIEKIPKPPMYKDEFSWKRFLPPLPRHKGQSSKLTKALKSCYYFVINVMKCNIEWFSYGIYL